MKIIINLKKNHRPNMIERQYLIKFFLCILIFILAFLMWVEGSTSLASISGILGFLFLVPAIYGCKKYKVELTGLNVAMFGLGFILLLQIFLSWNYNPFLSITCGLSGFIFFTAAAYDKKQKNEEYSHN
mgnify:CR=1 FL=1|jgi:hypothetical protein